MALSHYYVLYTVNYIQLNRRFFCLEGLLWIPHLTVTLPGHYVQRKGQVHAKCITYSMYYLQKHIQLILQNQMVNFRKQYNLKKWRYSQIAFAQSNDNILNKDLCCWVSWVLQYWYYHIFIHCIHCSFIFIYLFHHFLSFAFNTTINSCRQYVLLQQIHSFKCQLLVRFIIRK